LDPCLDGRVALTRDNLLALRYSAPYRPDPDNTERIIDFIDCRLCIFLLGSSTQFMELRHGCRAV
jgi:hypothetical protein